MMPWKSLSRVFLLSSLLISLLAGISSPVFVDESVSAAPKALAATSIVISEFRTRGPSGASDEFVEIYNPTSAQVNIGGWKLRVLTSTGTEDDRVTIPTGQVLLPGQYYLIANDTDITGYSGSVTPNLTYGVGIFDAGGIAIFNNSGIKIDSVGLNTVVTTYTEIAPLDDLTSNNNQSYERKLGGASDSCQDDGNNSDDFLFNSSTSNPQNLSTPRRLCGISSDLRVAQSVNIPTQSVGFDVVFTITVTNDGPNDATNVIVKDVLPAGLDYVNNNLGAAYNDGNGMWNVGTLTSGNSAELQITATVMSVGAKTNWAEVWSADQVDPDSIAGNSSTSEDDDASATVTPPAGSADLSVTQSGLPLTPGIGDNVVFTITVTNAAGPSDATNLQVRDQLPAGLEYVSDNGGGSYVSVTGIWTAGTLTSGTSKTLKITARVATGGAKTNWAEVWSVDQSDPNSIPGNSSTTEDDDASVTVTPSSAQVDLSLTQSWSKSSPGVAGNATFTITVANPSATTDATNVEVRDILPSGLSYVSNDLGAAYNKTTGIWTVGTVTKGTSKTLKITAKILTSGTKTNLAEIWQADQFDPNTSNNSDSEIPEMVDLSLTMSMSNVPLIIGNDVSFTIRVSNADDFDDATNVVVKDLLPTSYTYVSDSGAGAYISSTGYWTVGALPSNTSKTLTITATVNSSTILPNKTFVYDVTQVDIDSIPGNEISTEDDYASAPAADLNLTQSVDNVNPDVGAEVVFTITVNNAGVGGTTNVQVKDILPSGLTYVSNDRGTAYTSSTGIWVVGSLSNGASQTLKIKAKVTTNGIKTNFAEVWKSDQPDPDSRPANSSTTEDDDASATITSRRSIIINEIAWSGTAASTSDEWIELYNPSTATIDISGWTLKSASGSINISLSGTIKAGEYFLLERDDNNTVSDVTADQIYTGALSDSGEVLVLRDGSNNFIDSANDENDGTWPKGSASPSYGSMERQGTTAELDKVWVTNIGNPKNGKDANNGLITGTPRKVNSKGTSTTLQ